MPHDEFWLTRESIFTTESWFADVWQNIHNDSFIKLPENQR